MPPPVTRRGVIRGPCSAAAAAAAAPGTLVGVPQPPPVDRRNAPDSEELTHYQIGPHIWLRWHNEPLLAYRAHPTQKYPYLYPLAGPASGLSLTAESALPWPHHRSVLFGCDHVNGGNYWQDELERGQIVSRGPRVRDATKRSAVIEDASDWRQPGGPVQMTDERRYTVRIPDDRHRIVDVDITWRAEVDVTIEKTNHALFAIRAVPDVTPWGGGRLVSSNGDEGEGATFGKPAGWCAFAGRRTQARGEPVEGIALMDHPDNPWAPCPWFTRDYGFMSPMAFNWIERPWRLPAGQSVRLRHRVVVFAGEPHQAELDTLFKEWTGA